MLKIRGMFFEVVEEVGDISLLQHGFKIQIAGQLLQIYVSVTFHVLIHEVFIVRCAM